MPLPPRQTGRHLNAHHWPMAMGRAAAMVYSYTQISQYLRCPRSYRYRYLDGWREKETRAAMVFGRCFEKALGAYFGQEDSAAVLFKEWNVYRDGSFEYRKGESWDHIFHQGVHLLEAFARDNRIRVRSPKKNLQIKMLRTLPGGSEFVSYLDAIGEIDGQYCLIDWKTTTSRYSTEPEGLLALDPQLICYSWISGISEVAVFVLGKIDEILSWEKTKEQEKDARFVELGEYLCEVRSKQYWRLQKLKSFDEFLEKCFPESRRKAYYLMAIHEHLTRVPKQQLREVGWSKAVEQ